MGDQTLDDVAPLGAPDFVDSRGRPHITVTPNIKQAPPGDQSLEDVAPPNTNVPLPDQPRSLMRDARVAATAAINAPMEVAGLPGEIGRAAEPGLQRQEQETGKSMGTLPGAAEVSPGDPETTMAARHFISMASKHMPSGADMKDWFWNQLAPHLKPPGPENIVGPPLSQMRQEPETSGERALAEGVKTGVTGPITKGAVLLGGAAGAMGEIFAQAMEAHPEMGRFIGSMGTALGIPLAMKTGQGLRYTIGSALEARRDPEKLAAAGYVSASGRTAEEAAADLNKPQGQTVPGVERTSGQVSDNPNLIATEKGIAGNNPRFATELAERQADQNAARQSALDMAPTGDARAPGEHLESQRKAIQTQLDQIQNDAADNTAKALKKLGPGAEPMVAGQTIRKEAETGMAKAERAVGQAYDGVLAPGRGAQVGIDPGPAIQRVDRVLKDRYGPKNPPPEELNNIREEIANDGNSLSYKDITDLSNRLSRFIGGTTDKAAQTAAIEMKQILFDRMDASASEMTKALPHTAAVIDPAGPGAKFSKDRLTRLNELRDTNGQAPLARWAASREALENKITELEGKIKDKFGINENLTEPEFRRYLYAREMNREVQDRWHTGAMEDITAGGREYGGTRLTPSEVPGRIFHADARSSREDMQQFIDALGGNANAEKALEEYAVRSLKNLVDKKGGLTQAHLDQWMRDHRWGLEAFPNLQGELNNLTGVNRLLAARGEIKAGELDAFTKSAAAHFLSKDSTGRLIDPDAAIKSALRSRTSQSDMKQLWNMVRNDPDAAEGFRKLIIENGIKSSTTEGIRDVRNLPMMMDQKFAEWLKENKPAIVGSGAFTPDQIKVFESISEDLLRGRGGTFGKAPPPPTVAQAWKAAMGGISQYVPTLVPNLFGLKPMVQKMIIGNSEEKINAAFNRMLLDPEHAKLLLKRVTGDQMSNWAIIQQVSRALGMGTIGKATVGATGALGIRSQVPEEAQQ